MPAAPSDPAQRVTDPVPGRAGRSGADTSGTRRPRLVSDSARYVLATAVTAVLGTAYGVVAGTVEPGSVDSLGFVVSVYFGVWSVYSLLYAGLTWAVLRPADGDQLVDWLTEDRRGRRRRRRTELIAGSGGPLGAVSCCAVAIGAVVCASILPELRDDPVVIALAVLVVTASWLLIVTVYTVHYARENAHLGGLKFSSTDDGPPRLTDYVYLSVQISTAYNSADVTVTGRAMRQTTTVHAVVAFVFNTVLITLLVSLLVTVTT